MQVLPHLLMWVYFAIIFSSFPLRFDSNTNSIDLYASATTLLKPRTFQFLITSKHSTHAKPKPKSAYISSRVSHPP